jgi:hypothetical protein
MMDTGKSTRLLHPSHGVTGILVILFASLSMLSTVYSLSVSSYSFTPFYWS